MVARLSFQRLGRTIVPGALFEPDFMQAFSQGFGGGWIADAEHAALVAIATDERFGRRSCGLEMVPVPAELAIRVTKYQ